MNNSAPRVAFFTDCYHEINGVATTSREFVKFAKNRHLPMLAVHAGERGGLRADGAVTHFEFMRRFPRLRLDADMAFDLAFLTRHLKPVEQAFRAFEPTIVHATGPSDSGLMGLILAHRYKVPMIASWHTNLHEYAGRRLPAWLPGRSMLVDGALHLLGQFYRYPRRTLAPNPELTALLESLTKRPSSLMERGVDVALFQPAKRIRECNASFRIGYVGRLSREKNVRLLAELDERLQETMRGRYEFCIVGQGDELEYLQSAMKQALFRGVLRGESLARAYADFDAFVFPSETDTYGNVVQEALASGVPALVTGSGGPKFLIEHGVTGFVCNSAPEFAHFASVLIQNPARHAAMRAEARKSALRRSWDKIFEGVYEAYGNALLPEQVEARAEL